MRRSERLFREGVYFALQSIAFFTGSIAFSVWGYALTQAQNILFVVLWIIALVCIFFCLSSAGEARRIYLLSLDEESREHRNATRPRI